MAVLQIGAKDFVKGCSTSNDLPDGGFSPNDKGHNLLSSVGMVRGSCPSTSRSSNLVSATSIIASTIDGNLSGNDLYFVGAPSGTGASFYKWSSYATEPTLEKTDAGARTYSIGKTDMQYYGTDTFVTSATDVAKLTNNMAALDEDWWTATVSGTALTSSYPHPMLVFDLKLWIADGQLLHNWNGSVASNSVLDLGAQRKITALGRYESTGDMLIAVEQNANLSGTSAYQSRILVWDGFSQVVNQEIFVDDKITAFFNQGGITYVFYGRNFGYFNGSGITFIRKLNIDYSSTSLIYPHKVTNINNVIYIAEGQNVLAYGKLYQGGNNVFWYPWTGGATINSNTQINILRHFRNANTAVGTNLPLLAASYGSTSTITMIYINTESSEAGTNWRSNKYYLPQNCRISRVEAFTDVLTSGETFTFRLYVSKDMGAGGTQIGTMSYASDGAIDQKTFFPAIKTALIQLRVTLPATSGLKGVNIYYEPIEEPV